MKSYRNHLFFKHKNFKFKLEFGRIKLNKIVNNETRFVRKFWGNYL